MVEMKRFVHEKTMFQARAGSPHRLPRDTPCVLGRLDDNWSRLFLLFFRLPRACFSRAYCTTLIFHVAQAKKVAHMFLRALSRWVLKEK